MIAKTRTPVADFDSVRGPIPNSALDAPAPAGGSEEVVACGGNLPTAMEHARARIRELETTVLVREIEALRATQRAERAEAQLSGAFPFAARAAMVNGRIVQLASKAELALFFGASESTIDDWARRGILPDPIQVPRAIGGAGKKSRRGRKYLRWDFPAAVDQVQRFRRSP